MNIARSSLLIFSSRVIKSIAGFIAVVLFSRGLGATPLGKYYSFVALIGLISLPTDFGIDTAVQKRISEDEDSDAYLGSAILLKIPILLVIVALIWLGREYIDQFLGANLWHLFIICLIISQVSYLALAVLRGELRVSETAGIEVLRPLCWLSTGYLLYIQGFGVYALVYGYLLGSLLMAVIGWWKVSTSIVVPDTEHIRSLFNYSRYSVISSIGGYFYSWMDVGILTIFVTAGIASSRGEIGAYENAWRLSLIIMMLTQSISVTLFPQISRWEGEDAINKIESIIPTALLPGVFLIIPGFIGTLILSKDLLRVLFGQEFVVAWLVLIIFSGEKLFQSIHSVFGNVLQGMDRPDLAAYSTIVAISVNLILNIVLIWAFGIVGAALATTTASIVRAAIQIRYISQSLYIKYPIRETIGSGIASIIMGVCIHLVLVLVEINSIIQLVGIVLLGAVIYTAIALMFTSVRETIQQLLRPLLSNIVTS